MSPCRRRVWMGLWLTLCSYGALEAVPSTIYRSNQARVLFIEGDGDVGSAVLLPDGFILTCDRTGGYSGMVSLIKDDVWHGLRPFWRSPVDGVALWYTETMEPVEGREQRIRPDFFRGSRNVLDLPEKSLKLEIGETLTVIGRSSSRGASKRLDARVLDFRRRESGNWQVKVAMAVPGGWLGAAAFAPDGTWVGVLTAADVQDESEETPVAWITRVEGWKATRYREMTNHLARVLPIHALRPDWKHKPGAERKIQWEDFRAENCSVEEEGHGAGVHYEGNADGGRWVLKDPKVATYFLGLDWYGESGETEVRQGNLSLEILLRGDEKSGLFLVLGEGENRGRVEVRKGKEVREIPCLPMPWLSPGYWYHLDIRCQGEKVWVSVHGLPVFSLEASGFGKGGPAIRFTGRGPQSLENINLSIPK